MRTLFVNNLNNNSNVNGNNNLNNNGSFLRITQLKSNLLLRYKNIYEQIYSFKNLYIAFLRASKGRKKKRDIIIFTKNLETNLLKLQNELIKETYKPKPLNTFIIRDPKTRKISKSNFRDRIIHHALYRVIAPYFEKQFIYDSYANQKEKGTQKALERFDYFKRKASKNNSKEIYILKADIKRYFETVDHKFLLEIISTNIKDKKTINLINKIVSNHNSLGIGMPLGNLTSQFFANVYLNKLDQFVKHDLKVKYYIRYVDDFVIININKNRLNKIKNQIQEFLRENLNLELHPKKTKIILIHQGVQFLGLRIFIYHKLLTKKNIKKFKRKFNDYQINYIKKRIDYDKIYNSFEGWIAYSKNANTYKLRIKFTFEFENLFPKEISTKEVNRYVKLIKQ